MTELPIIDVYCDGPPDAPHDRYTVARYQRTHGTPTTGPSLWSPLRRWSGGRTRNVEQEVISHQPGDPRRGFLRYRFRCDECGYDEIRNEDDRDVGDRVFAVFDGLWAHGVSPLEISVRGLVREIGR
jgi:hypothetical protein